MGWFPDTALATPLGGLFRPYTSILIDLLPPNFALTTILVGLFPSYPALTSILVL